MCVCYLFVYVVEIQFPAVHSQHRHVFSLVLTRSTYCLSTLYRNWLQFCLATQTSLCVRVDSSVCLVEVSGACVWASLQIKAEEEQETSSTKLPSVYFGCPSRRGQTGDRSLSEKTEVTGFGPCDLVRN
uniref:Uncharacterized protein n=1 Tax=Neolamprologus brichardi TaxID=32507 RepID=A0A3Q4G3P9_NEOBR